MKGYENSYFGIKITFSDEWYVSHKPRTKTDIPPPINYQTADDDLPEKDDDFRTLVSAFRKSEDKPNSFRAGFSIVVHKQDNNYQVSDELKNKGKLIECKVESLNFLNRPAQSVKYIEDAITYNYIGQIISLEIEPKIWMNIYFDGNSPENFKISEEILKNIELTK